MRKLFILALLCGMFMSSCTKCSNGPQDEQVVEQDTAFVVEAINQSDFDSMIAKYSDTDFRWYECDILLKDFLDEECDGTIEELVNVYQTVTEKDGGSFDTQVYKVQHFADGTVYTDSIKGFWIEDYPITMEDIKVSYAEAFELIMAVNLPKPHSQYVTIRKPIGPLECNTQYIFGNIHAQIWVDAVTGEIREANPAFPQELQKPLGEWP